MDEFTPALHGAHSGAIHEEYDWFAPRLEGDGLWVL